MKPFHSRSIACACAVSVGATLVVTASARQSGPGSVESHIEAARRAAGADYLPVFDGLCGSLTPPPAAAADCGPAGGPHLAAQWGGTGFNFTITPEHTKPYWFETYARSASHFAEAVAASGADVHIANHPNQDGAAPKLVALAGRKPGARHPFVVGNATILRYLTMVRECAQAGLATSR